VGLWGLLLSLASPPFLFQTQLQMEEVVNNLLLIFLLHINRKKKSIQKEKKMSHITVIHSHQINAHLPMNLYLKTIYELPMWISLLWIICKYLYKRSLNIEAWKKSLCLIKSIPSNIPSLNRVLVAIHQKEVFSSWND